MAVSLAQYSRAVGSRPRSTSSPISMPPTYNPSEYNPSEYRQNDFLAIPTPEQFAIYPAPAASRPNRHSYTSAPTQWQPPPPEFQSEQEVQQSPYKLLYSPLNYPSPLEPQINANFRPPVPPKHPLAETVQAVPSPTTSSHSASSAETPRSSHISIEPDPLPPHSNPQALTKTQSEAFVASKPIPGLHVGVDEVRSSKSGLPDFRIWRESYRGKLLSSKPLIKVTKISTSRTAGTIKFHTVTSNRIDLIINDRETSISHQGVIHNRWGFEPTSPMTAGQKWFWKKDRSTGGAMLEDAKRHGNVLARMKGDLLTFERGRLSPDNYDEIVVSAIAMAEAARRQKRKGDIVDIASAIGDFADSSGGGDGGGDGGGGD